MNKELSIVPSKIMQNKLAVLALRLQQQANPSGSNIDFPTLERTIIEATKILSEFYKRLSEPNYKPEKLVADTIPDPEVFNQNFQAIADDLEVIFAEFENLESVVVGSFNYLISRMNRLNGKMKSVYSNLGDYILYADLPTKDAIFFQDSFNDLTRIEVDSPLLSLEQCEISQVEGIVTLPVDRESESIIKIAAVPVINQNSNGDPGNNYEKDAAYNGNISLILDSNADTWFEYERVVAVDDGLPLVLDITITLPLDTIINYVRVNPNNFGTKTQVEILSIETSLDGSSFVSIKDDIPIAGFVVEDEENIFTLAPSTSKYAGQGVYTFTPRKASFLKLTLRQTTPYVIPEDQSVDSLEYSRYAIGIRDVEVRAIYYKAEGEIISSAYNALEDVRKVAVLSNQRPDPGTSSLLTSIDHFISPDDGITWHQVRPMVSAGVSNKVQDIPEVLDFNGIGDTSIKTDNPVITLRYKAVLKRNTEAFISDAPELAKGIKPTTELHAAPVSTPLEMTLRNRPIDGTIEVIEPLLGSRGRPEVRYQIATGNGGALGVTLPFQNIKRDFETRITNGEVETVSKTSPIKVYVDGIEWTEGDINAARCFRLNTDDGKLTFSDGVISGTPVRDGAVVSASLTEERLFVGEGAFHVATLAFTTASDKNRTEISVKYPSTSTITQLKRGEVSHKLMPDIDESEPLAFSDGPEDVLTSGAFLVEVDFVDGTTEFVGLSGVYSVDHTNGRLCCPYPTHMTKDISVGYSYFPRDVLDSNSWDFIKRKDIEKSEIPQVEEYLYDEGKARSLISIKPEGFISFTSDEAEYIPIGTGAFVLNHPCLVPGTLKIVDEKNNNAPPQDYFTKRVELIKGREELTLYKKVGELADILQPVTGYFFDNGNVIPIYKWTFKQKVKWGDGYSIYWSATTGLLKRNRRTDPGYNNNGVITSLAELNRMDLTGDFVFLRGPDNETVTLYVVGPFRPDAYGGYLPGSHLYLNGWKPSRIWLDYYTRDPLKSIDGKYMVNWETGEMQIADILPDVNPFDGISNTNRYRLSYDYTSYYAKYDVGRLVPENEWTYNADANSVSVDVSEKTKSLSVPLLVSQVAASKYYQISYDRVVTPREDIKEIEPYFTPVLKDYALKVVTRSRLI